MNKEMKRMRHIIDSLAFAQPEYERTMEILDEFSWIPDYEFNADTYYAEKYQELVDLENYFYGEPEPDEYVDVLELYGGEPDDYF